MIYLDNAATTLQKPPEVAAAMLNALKTCANPGRGGHAAARRAGEAVYQTRALAARFFDMEPEQVCFTSNATDGLNIALRTLLRPGSRVVISGLEHNAVTRTLAGLGAVTVPVTAPLFDAQGWLSAFEAALNPRPDAVVCLHVSNVYGCVLPVEQLGALCAKRELPFVVDASQSAGLLPVLPKAWGAAFVAMPGHKGLLGPQGTGLLLCRAQTEPLRFGGTGSHSAQAEMPTELPDRLEAGTLNVPGIAGLGAGISYLLRQSPALLRRRETQLLQNAVHGLQQLGIPVFSGAAQAGVVSFRMPGMDCEEAADAFARRGIALRAGLHCAPLAHRTGGTFPEGTVRMSLSALSRAADVEQFLHSAREIQTARRRAAP